MIEVLRNRFVTIHHDDDTLYVEFGRYEIVLQRFSNVHASNVDVKFYRYND